MIGWKAICDKEMLDDMLCSHPPDIRELCVDVHV